MKKVLFATTALIATAGMAAAEINFGGSARFGVVYNDSLTGDKMQIHNRFTLNIDGSAETDSGIEFFARVRVRGGNQGTGATSASGVSAPRVGMSVAGFTVATGNILGAYESAPGLYDGSVGLTGLGWGNLVGNTSANGSAGAFAWDSFSSAGGGSNGLEVIYSNAGFGAHLSWSNQPGRGFTGTAQSSRTALNLSYNFGDWTVSGAYQDSAANSEDKWALHAGGSFGNFGVGIGYGDNDGTSKVRLNGSASVGAGTTITAYVADEKNATDTNWGLGFTHSLGGAVLAGGVANTATGTTLADLGVRFSF